MSLSVATAGQFLMSDLKANLEYRLIKLVSSMQRFSTEKTELANKYQLAVNSSSQDEDSELNSDAWEEAYTEYTTQMSIIQAKEKEIEMEKTNIETQLQEIQSMLDSYKSLAQSEIKNICINASGSGS